MTRAITIFIIFITSANLFSQVRLDNTFGNGGIVTTESNVSTYIQRLAVQADGKILALGNIYNDGNHYIQLARYHTNGTLDHSFGDNGLVRITIGNKAIGYALAIQPDGKILLAGTHFVELPDNANHYNSVIIRCNTDGSIDNSFASGGFFKYKISNTEKTNGLYAIKILADGKIIAAGGYDNTCMLIKLNSDGRPADNFGEDGIVLTPLKTSSYIEAIAIDAEEKIIASGIAGESKKGEDMNYDCALLKYNSNGSLDKSFGTGGVTFTDIYYEEGPNTLALQEDGKIVVAGAAGFCFVARYNIGGMLDSTFGLNGMLLTEKIPMATDMAIQADDKILLAGVKIVSGSNADFCLTRINADGQLDTTFGNNGSILTDINTGSDNLYSIAIQADHKILLGGSSRKETSPGNFALIRLTSDITGIKSKYSSTIHLKVYPNPCTDNIKISLRLAKTSNLTITVTNLAGKQLMEKVFKTNNLEETFWMNKEEIAPGTYLINVFEDGKKLASEKFIKVK